MMGFGFGFPFMFFFWILLIGLGIWVVFQVVTRSGSNASGGGQPQITSQQDNALDVLKKRYARGEITKGEYEEMRSDLLA